MPYRMIPLANGEYYHVFNRGVASQPTYYLKKDYERFLLYLSYYCFNNLPFKLSKLLQRPVEERGKILQKLKNTGEKNVEIIAFCLMPNHFHLLLKQEIDSGISSFMRKITDGFTRYFNTKHERIGPVFQGAFKAVHVGKDEQLIHLSRYIHLNPFVSFVVREENFLSYPWSSLKYYLESGDSGMVNIKSVLEHFKSPKDYLNFVLDRANYGKELEKIKHLILER